MRIYKIFVRRFVYVSQFRIGLLKCVYDRSEKQESKRRNRDYGKDYEDELQTFPVLIQIRFLIFIHCKHTIWSYHVSQMPCRIPFLPDPAGTIRNY